jgi:O-antigen/teichoic acid export membrane protein
MNLIGKLLVKNTLWLFLANVLAKLFKLGLVIMMARQLGPAAFGHFSYFLSLFSLIYLVLDVGISQVYVREFQRADVDDTTLFGTSIYAKTLMSIITLLLLLGYSVFVQPPELKIIAILTSLSCLIWTMRLFFVSVTRSRLQMKNESISFCVENFVTSFLGIGFLFFCPSLPLVAFAYFLGALMGLVVLLALSEDILPLTFRFEIGIFRRLFPIWVPVLGTSIVYPIISTTDTVLLNWMVGPESVGIYQAAYKFIQFLGLIPFVFASVMYPFFSKWHQDTEQLVSLIRFSFSFSGFVVLPFTVAGVLLAPSIFLSVYGPEFAGSVPVFMVFLALLLPFFITTLFNQLLLALDAQVQNFWISSLTAVVNLVLNLIFIVYWGVIGATLATVISRWIDFALTYFVAYKRLNAHMLPLTDYWIYVLASVLMGGVIYLFLYLSAGYWILPAVAGPLIYCAILWLLRKRISWYGSPAINSILEIIRNKSIGGQNAIH